MTPLQLNADSTPILLAQNQVHMMQPYLPGGGSPGSSPSSGGMGSSGMGQISATSTTGGSGFTSGSSSTGSQQRPCTPEPSSIPVRGVYKKTDWDLGTLNGAQRNGFWICRGTAEYDIHPVDRPLLSQPSKCPLGCSARKPTLVNLNREINDGTKKIAGESDGLEPCKAFASNKYAFKEISLVYICEPLNNSAP